ncbi:MAG: D-2-hydroxyacid dehydrogenase [Gammaproteobacteria bacterium]|nr:D-2-hydroxyacid dehydrogenase [Gammaproteobacteria bacterium]MBV8308547.1 D-2-hydroxyacid dehydrogenase [Gammaproteobacteria bacterium]MBV8405808.1 D-2-hydroxyacid dehydrogenase [Gammaproteobacteria bacterium]
MTLRVVFLDRASIIANVRRPRAATDYLEYPRSDAGEVVERLRGASVAITNKVPLRAEVLRELPELRLIAVAATGYDVIDTAWCRAHGVAVANIRDYAVHTVPEHAFALILALRRNLIAYRADVERGVWNRSEQFCFFDHPILDLHGAQLGIIGEGVLGRAMAAIGTAFGMQPVFLDHPQRVGEDLEYQPLPRLLAGSDVVTLHCPLLPGTRNLIGEAQLRAMKRTAILINTARGGLVDEAALARALQEGWIGGAGFDVLTVEPPRAGNPLLELRLPNLIITPHIAWASQGAMQFLADQLIDNIDAWAAGTPQNLVA